MTTAISRSDERRNRLLKALSAGEPSQGEQLAFLEMFAGELPSQFTALFELFDSVPKFFAGAVTDKTQGGPLDIVRREFRWNDAVYTVQIAPSVVSSRDKDGVPVRKEILPGEREEYVWLVVRKLASEPTVRRGVDEKGVYVTCTISQIRRHLEALGRGYRAWEIREALEILTKTPLHIRSESNGKVLFAGPYLLAEYVAEPNDDTGERTICRITFNKLAAHAMRAGLYDRIHYGRFASLKGSLARWIYERMVLNFRQAGAESGYTISLSLILREGPMRCHARTRKAIQEVRKNLAELSDLDRTRTHGAVLSALRPFSEEIAYSETGKRGRRPIKEVLWTLYPAPEIVSEIKSSNAAKLAREEKLVGGRGNAVRFAMRGRGQS